MSFSATSQRQQSSAALMEQQREKTSMQEEIPSRLKRTVRLIAAGSRHVCEQDRHHSGSELITSKEALELSPSAGQVVSVHLCSPVAIGRWLHRGRER